MSKLTLKQRRERNMERARLVTELNVIKFKLGRVGLFKTMHAVDEATRCMGWEMAETNQS